MHEGVRGRERSLCESIRELSIAVNTCRSGPGAILGVARGGDFGFCPRPSYSPLAVLLSISVLGARLRRKSPVNRLRKNIQSMTGKD